MNITLLLSKIGLSTSLSQDVTLVLLIALISFIFGMVLGKHKLMSVLVNIYVSFAVISVVPKEIFTQTDYKFIAFIILLAVLFIRPQGIIGAKAGRRA